MKKFFIALFALLILFGGLHSTFLFADATQYDMGHLNHFDYFWSGDDEDLCFNINLAKGLQFNKRYYVIEMNNGQGCELTFYPLEGSSVLSSKGYFLQKASLIVEVKNGDEPNQVLFRIISKSSYSGMDEEGKYVTVTDQFMRKGSVKNPSLDLTHNPSFFTINEALNQGMISFKNSFPYSNMSSCLAIHTR
jgi:hypothetical protein